MIIKNKQKSFTLIELLVVIVIIGILAGVIMISTSSSIDKANFAKAQAFSSTVQNELLSNLVSEWTFDEPQEGNITNDSWGNNHGTVVGATQVADCVFGKCYSFDGIDDYIDFGNNNTLNIVKNITVSLWVNSSKPGHNPYLISKRNGTTQGFNIFLTNQKNVTIVDGAGTTINSDLSVEYNKWKNIVFYINSDATKYRACVDGVFGNEKSITAFSGNDTNLYVGFRVNGSASHYLDGSLDDIRIYNAALSSSQIKQNYIAGLNSMLANGNISKKEYNKRINVLAYDN
ncbi:MAG: LamG-like jellyroll fold domain-containing protein [Minisyncoccales bacterium]|jgi:prepilin-type N-terminal cleavage/methylation domain-containing protein